MSFRLVTSCNFTFSIVALSWQLSTEDYIFVLFPVMCSFKGKINLISPDTESIVRLSFQMKENSLIFLLRNASEITLFVACLKCK